MWFDMLPMQGLPYDADESDVHAAFASECDAQQEPDLATTLCCAPTPVPLTGAMHACAHMAARCRALLRPAAQG